MTEPSKETPFFRLIGRVVASRLPDGFVVPGLAIRRDPQASRLARPKNLLAKSDTPTLGFVSAAPSEISIEGDVLVEVRVRAADEADAVAKAQQTLIRPLTAALLLATGGPAHVELARIAREGPDGQVIDDGWSIWSDAGFMANLGEMPTMSQDETSDLLRVMRAFHHDKVAALAASDLVEAAKMEWTTGGRPAEMEASVLRKFLVIERIATRVATGRQPDSRERERQERIVSDLARDLRAQPIATSVRRVKNAAKALEEFENQRLTRDIPYACEALGLPSTVAEDALDLNKLRNQSLAHPGQHRAHHLLAGSGVLATSTAHKFLSAYANWRSVG